MKTIIQGEKKDFTITLTSVSGGITTLLDVSSAVEISVCFSIGATSITKTLTGSNVSVTGTGQVTTSLTTTDTDTFQVGTGDIEVAVDNGSGDVTKLQNLDSFAVVAKIC